MEDFIKFRYFLAGKTSLSQPYPSLSPGNAFGCSLCSASVLGCVASHCSIFLQILGLDAFFFFFFQRAAGQVSEAQPRKVCVRYNSGRGSATVQGAIYFQSFHISIAAWIYISVTTLYASPPLIFSLPLMTELNFAATILHHTGFQTRMSQKKQQKKLKMEIVGD